MLFRKYYAELDVARATAITLVMLFHFNEQIFHLPKNSFLAQLAAWGYHGVDLFFALSGFLIGGQIIEEALKGTFSFKKFYLKRFWRIVPPYYAAITAFVVFYSLGTNQFILNNKKLLQDFIIHIFYLQDYIRPIMYGGLYWSLAVEEQFYIIAPILVFLLIKLGRRSFFIGLLLAISASIIIRNLLYDPQKEWWISFYVPFHVRFDSLLIGVFAAFIFITFYQKVMALTYKVRLIFLSTAIACLIASFVYGNFGQGSFNAIWQFTLTGIGFSILLLLAVSWGGGGSISTGFCFNCPN